MNAITLIIIIALFTHNIIAKPLNETLNDLNLNSLDESSSKSFEMNESETVRENYESEKQFTTDENFYQKNMLQADNNGLRSGKVLIFRPLFVYNQQQKRKQEHQQQLQAHRRKDTIQYQPQLYNNSQKPKQKHCFYY